MLYLSSCDSRKITKMWTLSSLMRERNLPKEKSFNYQLTLTSRIKGKNGSETSIGGVPVAYVVYVLLRTDFTELVWLMSTVTSIPTAIQSTLFKTETIGTGAGLSCPS